MSEDHARPPPPCPNCRTSMVLASVAPRVATFPELRTFRCTACGDVQTFEKDGTNRLRLEKSGGATVMPDEQNRVDHLADGTFTAFWRGRVVYEGGRVKHFKAKEEASEFLARCNAAGKIVH